MKHIDHIAIAVQNMTQSKKLFAKIFGKSSSKSETIDSESVEVTFFDLGNSKIELISPLNSEGPISKYLERHPEGMHHIAFYVDDILLEMERLKKEGISLLNESQSQGAGNKLICFLHPKDTNGVLIELCQKMD